MVLVNMLRMAARAYGSIRRKKRAYEGEHDYYIVKQSTVFLFLFLYVKRLHSNLNIMSLVLVEKKERKNKKNRKGRNKVDGQGRKKGKFPACDFKSLGN